MIELGEMNLEQKKEMFHSVRKLEEQAFDRAMDNAAFWCEEYLNCWKRTGGIDYSIGWDRGAFFTVKNRERFLNGLESAQKNYGFLPDSANEDIDLAWDILRQIDSAWDKDELEQAETEADRIFDRLENDCFDRIMSEYRSAFENDTIEDAFLECIFPDLEEQGYIYDEQKKTLYRVIPAHYVAECVEEY